ncbi:MAG: hypothetical protein M1828_000447 [Chrysothrix sp. TS-e1954]|nr:MAG: hypothetical protein M1828_000447 [Chrysothrix sp. TS-e1954]
MAPMPGMVPISVGAVAGIAVGGAVGLGIVLMLGYLLIARWKHKRTLRTMEEMHQRRNQPIVSQTATPPFASTRAVLSPRTMWKPLPSHESLHQEFVQHSNSVKALTDNARDRKRSSLLPWSASRKRLKKRNVPLRKIRQTPLSAIWESPRTVASDLPTLCELQQVRSGTVVEVEMTKNTSHNLTPPGTPTLRVPTRLRPPFTNPARTPDDVHPAIRNQTTSNRSVSLPSIAGSSVPNESARQRSQTHTHNRTRSVSLGNRLSSIPPDRPPPALPQLTLSEDLTRTSHGPRPSSRESMSSCDSCGSSVLRLTSPSSRTVTDFSQQHPATSLNMQVGIDRKRSKEALPRGGQEAIDGAPTSIPRASEKLARSSVRLVNASSSSLQQDISSHDRAIASAGGSNEAVSRHMPDTLSLSVPTVIDESRRSVTTPRRKKNTGKVTAQGSPAERQATSSGVDSTRSQAPHLARRSSEHSTQSSSARSSTSNPFSWDDTPSTKELAKAMDQITSQGSAPLTSALKNSPNAKKHKRQNTVRISIQPTILGPPSRSGSSSNLLQIAEEGPERTSDTLQGADEFQDALDLERDKTNQNRLSASLFQHELKLKHSSYCPSLTPSSPTLSVAPINQNNRASKSRTRTRRPSRSPTRRTSRPVSSSNSSITVSGFPDTPEFSFADIDVQSGAPKDPSRVPIPLNPSDPEVLPGLTLLKKQKAASQQDPVQHDLTFPTIQFLQSSPPRSSEDFEDLYPRPVRLQLHGDSPHSSSPMTDDISPPPRSWSPPAKSAPTIKLDPSTSPPLPDRTMPLSSSIHPSNTALRPAPLSPKSQHPHGPRAAPAPDLVKSVRELRRMNSDTGSQSSIDATREERRYRHLGRDASPERRRSPNIFQASKDLGTATILSTSKHFTKQFDANDEKFSGAGGQENQRANTNTPKLYKPRDDLVPEIDQRKLLTPEPRLWMHRQDSDGSMVATGELKVGDLNFTPGDLWDENGFLITDDDASPGLAI